MIARKVAPALITGNTIVIKSSEETSNNAFLFSKIISELDLPEGIINFVYGRGEKVGKYLSSHPDIDLASDGTYTFNSEASFDYLAFGESEEVEFTFRGSRCVIISNINCIVYFSSQLQ